MLQINISSEFFYFYYARCNQSFSVCDVHFETDSAEISEDAGSEEAEDSDFWEGVTKPGNSKTTDSKQENQV